MQTIIFVVTHKLYKEPNNKIYKTITVGTKDLKIENSYRDNTGINIAYKNKNFCELTALYWIWKNINDNNIITGICHYRRFFSKSKCNKSQKFFLSKKDIEIILNKYSIILPEKNRWSVSVGEMYCKRVGKEKDLLQLRKKVIELFPEYLEDFDKVINAKSASYRNMFILKKNFLDEYCQWLFTILEDLEKDISLDGYTEQEARIYGYLSEILLNVWVLHKKLKVKYMPIVLTEVSNIKLIKMRIRNVPLINNTLNRLGI